MIPAISVVLCTYNRCQSLKRTLESFSRLRVPASLAWELVLVDNNSTDQTRAVAEEAAREWNLPIRYVFESNLGISSARNAGVREAKGEVIAFTDDDVILDPNWLVEIKKVLDQDDCMLVGGKIVAAWDRPRPRWLVREGPYKLHAAICEFDLGDRTCLMKDTTPYTANLALRKVAFEKYGFFRTDVGLKGNVRIPGHETEFCQRLRNGGEKFVYTPHAIVHHPVQEERTRKHYFRLWYFGVGRFIVQVHRFAPNAKLYFGVPRYFLRTMAENAMKWFFSFASERRFYYQLKTIQSAGEIYEAYQLSKKSK